MKYNIVINQKGLFNDKEISLTEASVIGWIHDFCGSNNKKINDNRIDGWTLVRGQFLVDDMPLLRIKTRSGGTRLLHRVYKLGYIDLKVEPRKLWIKTLPKMDKLWFDDIVDEASVQQVEDTKIELGASEQQLGASKQHNCSPQATYHYTNTNTITHSKTSSPIGEVVEIKLTRKEAREKKEKEYKFSEYMDSLIQGFHKPHKIIWLYFKKKKFKFENLAQWESAIKQNTKPANDLQGYNADQIEKTIDFCEEKWQDNWSLYAIVKQIANVTNKK